MHEMKKRLPSSYKDPSGFVFKYKHRLYREVNKSYKRDYDFLMQSGLYKALVEKELLISHVEVHSKKLMSGQTYKILQPETIPFISYPYEWCFGQLKSAALATLEIERLALTHGMTLKDASAFNLQFKANRPVLIDTLSFEIYTPGKPWVAYKQFCEQFLLPLALAAYVDVRLIKLLQLYLLGIPFDMAVPLLPLSSRLNPGLLLHIYFHGQNYTKRVPKNLSPKLKFSQTALLGLVESLESTVKSLTVKKRSSNWENYYHKFSYTSRAFAAKKQIIKKIIQKYKPQTVWDMGANTGEFSQLIAEDVDFILALDNDGRATEKHYDRCLVTGSTRVLPLIVDITNPTAAIGWANQERLSLVERGSAEMVLALALVHHLAISYNLPFSDIARYFRDLGRMLVIEFVPRPDPEISEMLKFRKDIFKDYSKENFSAAFKQYFSIVSIHPILESDRVIYLMRRKK
ncbi:hypothetical protein A2699_05415 [Candidatus Gottesmanbacteria bacterium RIFCSPHIGHO2_01_FULL_43_15]|nr:MAG: hypothetical protein A2699_05415 [Candidatus Gottesmanbacteria bacterium RIFCSPHIGHO2_01_FULL_43_15]